MLTDEQRGELKHCAAFDNLNARIAAINRIVESLLAQARAEAFEECAITAWNHYMDACKQKGYAPAIWQNWNAAAAIRARARPPHE